MQNKYAKKSKRQLKDNKMNERTTITKEYKWQVVENKCSMTPFEFEIRKIEIKNRQDGYVNYCECNNCKSKIGTAQETDKFDRALWEADLFESLDFLYIYAENKHVSLVFEKHAYF